MSIEVIKPGALSTFQDLGRVGYQHLGIPVNGVMDERAHRLANALVGNPPATPTLEITLMGADAQVSRHGNDRVQRRQSRLPTRRTAAL
jgi:allophanate hydrolase subunit 2